MYTFTDRSDRSLTLRPEGTAPICRAYVEHGMHRDPQPVKLFTIAPMYRYGAPGRGRYREHWQASVEALGTDDPAIDAELIQLYDTLLARLGITRVPARAQLDRLPRLPTRLPRDAARVARREPRPSRRRDAREGRTSPLRVFDNLARSRPRPGGARRGAEDRRVALRGLRRALRVVRADLDAPGSSYELVPTLVRGLDYYTRTTFEFIGPLENQNSTITGGGRYDYLVEEIGGPPTPGIGFGAGIERLLIAMEEEGVAAEPPAIDVFLALAEDGEPDAERGFGSPSCEAPGSPRTATTRALAQGSAHAGRTRWVPA